MNPDEFVARYENFPQFDNEHDWAVATGSLLGVLAVARENVDADMLWQYVDQMFGTMPLDLSDACRQKVEGILSVVGNLTDEG